MHKQNNEDIFLKAVAEDYRLSEEDLQIYKLLYSNSYKARGNSEGVTSADIETFFTISSETSLSERLERLEHFVKERNKLKVSNMAILVSGLCLRIMEDIFIDESHDGPLLTSEQRKIFTDFVTLLKHFKEKKIINISMFHKVVGSMENVPLEALWCLDTADIMPFIPFLKRNINNDLLHQSIAQSVWRLTFPFSKYLKFEEIGEASRNHCEDMDIDEDSDTLKIRTDIVGHLLLSMVRMVSYSSELLSDTNYESLCGDILVDVVEKIIDTTLNHNIVPINYLLGMYHTPSVVPGLLVPFASHHLKNIFVHEPGVSPELAISEQANWTFNSIPSKLVDFLRNILTVTGEEKVSVIINNSLKSRRVNWKFLLMTVSLYLNMFSTADHHIKNVIMNYLETAFLENNDSFLMAALLLARQCCNEKTALFPSYLAWFSSTFGYDANGTPLSATNKRSFMVLMDFLVKLVPFEPPLCLRVHVNKLPRAPADCNAELRDYVTLAKTRLADMKESDTLGLFGTVSVHEEDITRALAYFEQTGEITPAIMSAAVMRHQYYEQVFLAKLLEARKVPEPPDLKARFIEKLYLDGRVPKYMYQKYKENCSVFI